MSGHSHHHGEVRVRDAVFVNWQYRCRDRSGGTFAIVTYDGQFSVEFVYKQDLFELYGKALSLDGLGFQK